jgi:hypothetical protein
MNTSHRFWESGQTNNLYHGCSQSLTDISIFSVIKFYLFMAGRMAKLTTDAEKTRIYATSRI